MSQHSGYKSWPLKLLRWYCKKEVIDEIEGDLIETFYERKEKNPSIARRKLYKEILQSFNLRNMGVMENYHHHKFFHGLSMINQYRRVLIRTMKKSRIYTTISIASLTLAITCAGLIYLYIDKELTYDQVFTESEQIHRINHLSKNRGRTYGFAPLGMVPHLMENLDAVEVGTRIFKYRRAIPVTVAGTMRSFNEPRFGWADPSFFDVFDLELIAGDPKTVLNRPDVVVLSESTARKYFGDKDPVGQVINFNWTEESPLEVSGVFKDFPSNTSFQLDLISNIETCRKRMWTGGWVRDWNNMFVSAYLKIKPEGLEDVIEEAQNATSTYYTPDDPEAWITSLQPLQEIHLATPVDIGEWSKHNDKQTLLLFGVIGLIILCLGCFNFTNMVTAQAGQRMREVGVRKVLGSQRSLIAQQTFFETFSFVTPAGILSALIIYLLMPKLGELTSHIYALSDLLNLKFVGSFLLILLGVAVVAGTYPALIISGIQSIQLMKRDPVATGGKKVRSVLVTAQFTITTGLVICTLMVFLQLQYLRNKELGFDQSVIVNMPIHNDDAVIPKIDAFRNEVTANHGISQVTAASHEMFSDYTYTAIFDIEEFEGEPRWERYTVEQSYIDAFDLELVAGRSFDETISSDSNAFILNESAVKVLGISPEEVIDRTITDTGLEKTGKIVGVVKDFHYRSLHHQIQPFVLYVNWDRLDYISVRLNTENFAENIGLLEEGWYRTFGESVPFFYSFLDQQAQRLYQSEENEQKLFTMFSVVSIVLGAMGLFGFALFTTQKRFKEIGLRKVLGANAWQLIKLINQHFVRILVISFLLAAPFAFLLVNHWLSTFAYRIDQPIWVYLATAVMTFLIATVTVSYLSFKAASSNPIDSIKTE